MEIIYTDGMITINETILVILISFLMFVFILNRLMFRPLLATIEERQNRINGLEDDVVKMRKEADSLTKELRVKEEAAKSEARKFKNELEDAGSQKAGEISQTSREEIAKIRAVAAQEVEQQIQQARQEIKKGAESLGAEIVEKILGRRSLTG